MLTKGHVHQLLYTNEKMAFRATDIVPSVRDLIHVRVEHTWERGTTAIISIRKFVRFLIVRQNNKELLVLWYEVVSCVLIYTIL